MSLSPGPASLVGGGGWGQRDSAHVAFGGSAAPPGLSRLGRSRRGLGQISSLLRENREREVPVTLLVTDLGQGWAPELSQLPGLRPHSEAGGRSPSCTLGCTR